MRSKFVLLFLLSFLLLSSLKAVTPPSGIVAYVPVTIQNSQTSATPNPFQQMIQVNTSKYSAYMKYNNSFANFEFFYANGTIIPAWIESYSAPILTIWLKLKSIPASSSLTIYLGFASKSTNLLSSSGTSGIGEAPQLSPTYGQYDDGASVFNFYDNFAGTSLNTNKWTGSTAYASINNGLTYSYGSAAWVVIYSSAGFNPFTNIVEHYAKFSNFLNDKRIGWFSSSGSYVNVFMDKDSAHYCIYSWHGSGTEQYTCTSNSNTNLQIFSVWGVSSTLYGLINYGTQTTTGIGDTSTSQNVGIAIYGSHSNNIFVQWVRVRAYPPNGVMPSVSFGSVQLVNLNISISPSPPYTYPNPTITITATAPNSGDSLVLYFQKTQVASGTGSVTYTINQILGAGTYNATVVDLTIGSRTEQDFNVNQNSTYLITLSTTPSVNYIYNGTPIKATYSISTYKNQVTGILYLNKVSVASTTTSGSYTSSAGAGTYTFVFNTTGNANYSAKSVSATITINPAWIKITITNSTNSIYTTNYANIFTATYTTTNTALAIQQKLQFNFYVQSNLVNSTNTANSLKTKINSIGIWTIKANVTGNENFSSNTTTISNYLIYVPTYLINLTTSGNVNTRQLFGYSVTNIPTYLPIQLKANYSYSGIYYSLYLKNSSGWKLYYSNVANFTFTLWNPSLGINGFAIYEKGPLQTLIINKTLTTTATSITITNTTQRIQYYPTIYQVSTTPKAQQIGLWSYYNGKASKLVWNSSNTITFSTDTLTPSGIATLVYPFTSFNVSVSLGSFSPFDVKANLTTPNSYIRRPIVNITIFNQKSQNLKTITSTASIYLYLYLNGYTFTKSLSVTNYATFYLYVPLSNGGSTTNPTINILNNSVNIPSEPGFYPSYNMFMPVGVNYGQWVTWRVGLVDGNGSLYTFQVYSSTGYATNDYIVVQEGSGSGTIQAQSYFITQVPFSLPLENGQAYRFVIYNNMGTLLYQTSLTTWPSFITITIPTGGVNFTFPMAFPNVNCSSGNYGNNKIWIYCIGIDPTNFVSKWYVQFYNLTSILNTQSLLESDVFKGSSFSINKTFSSNDKISVKVVAVVGSTLDPLIDAYTGLFGNIKASGPWLKNPFVGVIALVLMLVLAFGTLETGMMDLAITFTVLGFWILGIFGIIQIDFVTLGVITLAGMIIIFISKEKQSKGT